MIFVLLQPSLFSFVWILVVLDCTLSKKGTNFFASLGQPLYSEKSFLKSNASFHYIFINQCQIGHSCGINKPCFPVFMQASMMLLKSHCVSVQGQSLSDKQVIFGNRRSSYCETLNVAPLRYTEWGFWLTEHGLISFIQLWMLFAHILMLNKRTADCRERMQVRQLNCLNP